MGWSIPAASVLTGPASLGCWLARATCGAAITRAAVPTNIATVGVRGGWSEVLTTSVSNTGVVVPTLGSPVVSIITGITVSAFRLSIAGERSHPFWRDAISHGIHRCFHVGHFSTQGIHSPFRLRTLLNTEGHCLHRRGFRYAFRHTFVFPSSCFHFWEALHVAGFNMQLHLGRESVHVELRHQVW